MGRCHSIGVVPYVFGINEICPAASAAGFFLFSHQLQNTSTFTSSRLPQAPSKSSSLLLYDSTWLCLPRISTLCASFLVAQTLNYTARETGLKDPQCPSRSSTFVCPPGWRFDWAQQWFISGFWFFRLNVCTFQTNYIALLSSVHIHWRGHEY